MLRDPFYCSAALADHYVVLYPVIRADVSHIPSLPSFPIRGGAFRPSERYLKLSLGALRIHTCCIPEARR